MQSKTPNPHSSHSPSTAAAPAEYADPKPLRQRLHLAFQPDSSTQSASQRHIRIDFNQLQPFERVERQFQNHGVTFKNAIALIPSNPSFQPKTGQTVLMGSPKNGWLEATFERPVRFVAGMVTASRSTVMAAYDANNRPLAQRKTAGPNLANGKATVPADAELSVEGEAIHRVTFHAFDGQLTVSDFSFGF